MPSLFDPLGWWRVSPAEAVDPSNWFDRWLEVTSWWLDSARSPAEAARHGGGEILAELVEGIARRYESKAVELSRQGQTVRAVLDSVRLVRRPSRFEARIDLSDLDWGGASIERASIVARSVQLQLGPPVQLVATGIEIAARVRVEELVTWLQPYVADWQVDADGAGQLRARHERHNVNALLEPSARGPLVDLELVEIGWRDWALAVPSWLRLRRTVQPTLPGGLRLVGGRRRRDIVEAELELDSVSERLDLGVLRDAIGRGRAISVGES